MTNPLNAHAAKFPNSPLRAPMPPYPYSLPTLLCMCKRRLNLLTIQLLHAHTRYPCSLPTVLCRAHAVPALAAHAAQSTMHKLAAHHADTQAVLSRLRHPNLPPTANNCYSYSLFLLATLAALPCYTCFQRCSVIRQPVDKNATFCIASMPMLCAENTVRSAQ